jgi:hypothetical protein
VIRGAGAIYTQYTLLYRASRLSTPVNQPVLPGKLENGAVAPQRQISSRRLRVVPSSEV